MAAPLTVTPITTADFVSTANSGLHMPDVVRQLTQKYPGQYGEGLFDFYFNNMMWRKTAHNQTYEWWEDDFIDIVVKIDGPVGPAAGAGQSLVVTIHADAHDASGTRTGIQVNDIILLRKTGGINTLPCRVTAYSSAVNNSHTMTLVPCDTSETIPALAQDDEFYRMSTMWNEGTGQPDARTPILNKRENDMQIFAESYRVAGTEMKQQIWPEVRVNTTGGPITMNSGQVIPAGGKYIYIKGANDTYWIYCDSQENAFMYGDRNDNQANMPDTAKSTGGLLPEIVSGGIVWNYTPGNITIQWWDQLIKEIKRNFGGKNYHCWLGIDLYAEIQNFFATAFNNGALNYGSFAGNKDLALAYRFASYEKTGIEFAFREYRNWNHPKRLGLPGYRHSEFGLLIPQDLVRNPKQNETTPPMCERYFEDRDDMRWLTGGRAPMNKTEVDELNIHFKCEKGIQVPAINRFAFVRPAA